MRVLKFRAWEEHDGKMYGCIVGNADKECDDYICPLIWMGDKGWVHSDTCKIMQYTGIKDVKGREIYEGDIVKCLELREDLREYISIVWWDDDGFITRDSARSADGFGLFLDNRQPLTEIEVIGNVFDWYDEDKYKELPFFDTREF